MLAAPSAPGAEPLEIKGLDKLLTKSRRWLRRVEPDQTLRWVRVKGEGGDTADTAAAAEGEDAGGAAPSLSESAKAEAELDGALGLSVPKGESAKAAAEAEAWVRDFQPDGTLTWTPATEARQPTGAGPGGARRPPPRSVRMCEIGFGWVPLLGNRLSI